MTEQRALPNNFVCSVIVPVYNGSGTIDRCLEALAGQTVDPGRYEVIVVDDGSTDGSGDLVQQWISAHSEAQHWRCVHQANAGPASARNLGVASATADLFLFTDADCAPVDGWIQTFLDAFGDPTVMGAKGTYLTDQPGLVPRFVQAEYEDRYDRMLGSDRIDFIDTYSAAYRRSIFTENGGFDAQLRVNEDQELSFRLAAKGYRLVFVPEAQVRHIHDRSIGEYVRRKYSIGFWKALLTRWHPEHVVQDSHTPQVLKIQMLLWAAMVSLLPLAILSPIWSVLTPVWIVLGMLMLLFLGSALPFVRKAARRSAALALFSPFMLTIRSLTLGAGYLTGTVHFAGTAPGVRQPVIPGWKRLLKRAMDIAGALVGLGISAPLILLAAIAIRLDSPGPIFYVQTRVGEHGRPFRIVKLRSMCVDADRRLDDLVELTELPEPAYKIPNDPRMTRVGQVLRRSSLDEVPQFWNVLRGDMSLVGPRPEEARVVALYSDEQRRRLSVKPGLTGPMQVNGRGDLPFGERLRLELDYIDNYSLRRDLAILLRTLPAVWQGRGAH